MSADRAEFILEGDATKPVAEMYRLDAVAKQLNATMKRLASDTTSDNETVTASLRTVAAEYLSVLSAAGRAKDEVKSLQQIQKQMEETRGRSPAQASGYQLQELDHYKLAAAEVE